MQKEILHALIVYGIIAGMVCYVIVAKPYESPMGMAIILIVAVAIAMLLAIGWVLRK